MIVDIAALAAAIAAGELPAVPILCDALEEAGRSSAARRLRLRFRRWQKAVCIQRQEALDWLEKQSASLREMQRIIQGLGGTLTWSLEYNGCGLRDGVRTGALISHQHALLREYVARLLREEGLAC